MICGGRVTQEHDQIGIPLDVEGITQPTTESLRLKLYVQVTKILFLNDFLECHMILRDNASDASYDVSMQKAAMVRFLHLTQVYCGSCQIFFFLNPQTKTTI